jgi:hypothetical protein
LLRDCPSEAADKPRTVPDFDGQGLRLRKLSRLQQGFGILGTIEVPGGLDLVQVIHKITAVICHCGLPLAQDSTTSASNGSNFIRSRMNDR